MCFAAILVALMLHLCKTSSTNVLGDYEYYIEKDNFVKGVKKAEQKCAQRNAKLAVINSQEIENFLIPKIGTLAGK